MHELLNKENIKIEDMIYEIRGKQVMLDSDLAKLYECKNGTKEINQAVKNNIEKFPGRFSWILTDSEYNFLRSKFLTSSVNHGGRRYKPRVFTEQGISMLSTILKSKTAIKVSIQIMDAFVMMRKYISLNNYDKRISNIETKLIDHDNKLNDHNDKFKEVFDKLDTRVDNHIFFEGQIYDAFSLLLDILNEAKDKIIIIDNYVDKKLLDILSEANKNIEVITNNINDNILEKYNKQYNNIKITKNSKFHDRFIILDYKILYHCGASFKDLGKKCFAINKIEDEKILNQLLKYIN